MPIKTSCSSCSEKLEPHRIGKNRYCLSCHAKYARKNRKRHSQLSPEAKKKAIARSYLNVYVRKGRIKRCPCVVCGKKEVEAHHEDYSKKLDVIWLCKQHHMDVHLKKQHQAI